METGRVCSRCGVLREPPEWYPVRANGKRQAWCKPCYRQWHRDRYATQDGVDDSPRSCEWCGESYTPRQRMVSTYCSRLCKDRAKNAALAAERLASKTVRQCVHCGGEMPPAMRSDAKFCAEECNSRAHMLKRKLRARGGSGDEIGYVRAAIANRDNWRCGICGGKVARDKRWPDPMCGSLDHVVPVSEGGTSEVANLRLAHLTCNVRRRDNGGNEQLALH